MDKEKPLHEMLEDILNEVFDDYFKNSLPARSTIQVFALPKDARVEIEAIGYIDV